MRTKNAITVRTKNGEKPLDGLAIEEKRKLLTYGRKFDPAASKAVWALHHAATMSTSPPNPAWHAANVFDPYRDKFMAYVMENYKRDWINGDGSFFRKLADAVEYNQFPIDGARAVIGGMITASSEHGSPMPSLSETIERCKECDVAVQKKTARRIFRDFGVKPSPEQSLRKRGPKLGSKHNPKSQRQLEKRG